MIKNNLSRILGEKRISITKLHELSGVSRVTLTNLYYERAGGIRFDTLECICKALRCDVADLLKVEQGEEP